MVFRLRGGKGTSRTSCSINIEGRDPVWGCMEPPVVISVGALATVFTLIKELSTFEDAKRGHERRHSRAMKRATPGSSSPSPHGALAKVGAEQSRQEGSPSIEVDRAFITKLARLMKVMVPSWRSREAGWLSAMVGLLVARIACDLRMISVIVSVESAIVRGERGAFWKHMGRFVRLVVPVACINSLLKYATVEVSLHFRQRLTAYLQGKYLHHFTFYAVTAGCHVDQRTRGIDQLITQDVERFCDSATDLLQNALKPLLDVVIYSRRLQLSAGWWVPAAMATYLLGTGAALTRARNPTGQYTALIQKREGDYRYVSNRLVTYAEEVAFYSGIKRERSVIEEAFGRLMVALRRSQQFRFSMDVLDSVVAKYMATALGWLLLYRALRLRGHRDTGGGARAVVGRRWWGRAVRRGASSMWAQGPMAAAQASGFGGGPVEAYDAFHRSARQLLFLAQAMASLVLAGRELTRLAGFTERVATLEAALDDVLQAEGTQAAASHQGGEGAGEVESGSVIEFDRVPVVTPTGEVLLPSLSLKVEAGGNVLVTGPNGAGKSSIFRILCGLWPVRGGRVVKPCRGQLFYIPQKPYLPLGNLRDQVLYPHGVMDMARDGTDDSHIRMLLAQVQLDYLCRREGGLEARSDWSEVLSGGEKQRIAMARLFYHRPQFAVLDECTSAVSLDVEGFLYEHCRHLGITLFTISHRPSLYKYHTHLLQLDGRGGYVFRELEERERGGEGAMQEKGQASGGGAAAQPHKSEVEEQGE